MSDVGGRGNKTSQGETRRSPGTDRESVKRGQSGRALRERGKNRKVQREGHQDIQKTHMVQLGKIQPERIESARA
jgi:hypothetical protein